MNINNFIDAYSGGARSSLFEVWVSFPEAVKNKFPALLANTTAYKNLKAIEAPAIAVADTPQAVFPTPPNIDSANGQASNVFNASDGGYGKYMAKSAKLPKSGTGTVEASYKGRKFKYPATRADEDNLAISFYNDTSFLVRNALEVWSQMQRTTQTNTGYYSKLLFGEIKVFQHDSLGNILKVYKFINAFPTDIGEIALSWDSENMEEFSATFTYHYYITDTSDNF